MCYYLTSFSFSLFPHKERGYYNYYAITLLLYCYSIVSTSVTMMNLFRCFYEVGTYQLNSVCPSQYTVCCT